MIFFRYLRTVVGVAFTATAIALFAIVGLASAGNTLDSNGNDWGPPPEAPHFETVNDVSNLCIDPPGEAWMVIHTDTNGVLSQTDPFLYYPNEDAVILHDTPHKCIPMDPPVCPDDAQVDQHIEMWATWNIGSGESKHLPVDIDCTPEPPVVEPPAPPAPPAGELIPAEVVEAPPAEAVACDPATCLPLTGSSTWEYVLTGLGLLTVGLATRRFARAEKRPALDPEA